MNIASYKLLHGCFGLIEIMIHSGDIVTYKALERNSKRIVVIKVIEESGLNTGLYTTLKELEMFESPFLVRYMKCYEDGNECGV